MSCCTCNEPAKVFLPRQVRQRQKESGTEFLPLLTRQLCFLHVQWRSIMLLHQSACCLDDVSYTHWVYYVQNLSQKCCLWPQKISLKHSLENWRKITQMKKGNCYTPHATLTSCCRWTGDNHFLLHFLYTIFVGVSVTCLF